MGELIYSARGRQPISNVGPNVSTPTRNGRRGRKSWVLARASTRGPSRNRPAPAGSPGTRAVSACRTDVWRPWRSAFTVPKAILWLQFREMRFRYACRNHVVRGIIRVFALGGGFVSRVTCADDFPDCLRTLRGPRCRNVCPAHEKPASDVTSPSRPVSPFAGNACKKCWLPRALAAGVNARS